MEITIETKNDLATLYKTQWKAYFKSGLCNPTVVYGESEEDAKKNALAHYRKNQTAVDFFPIDKVVDHVEFIG